MKISLSALVTAAAVASACSTPAAAPAAHETAKPPVVDDWLVRHVKVYVGDDALRVTVVRFMPPHGDDALLEITGTESDIDSIVMPHKFVDDHYETTIAGSAYWTMRSKSKDGRWDIWVGGESRKVSYDEEASAAVDAAELVRRHHEQVASGVIAELERFNREAREKYNGDDLAYENSRVEQDCGFSVTGTIDWSSIDDETIGQYSISGYCSPPAQAIRALCRREPIFKAKLEARIKQIHCRFGDELKIDLTDDGVLTWNVPAAGSNLNSLAVIGVLRHITDNPTVLATGRGHYVLLDPAALYESADDTKLYFGDDKVVHEQRPTPGQYGFDHGSVWAPRENHQTSVELVDGAWQLTCDQRAVALTEVSGTKRTDLLANVKMEGPAWDYEPYLLARDDLGNYYYIDQLRDGGKGFRVFRGPKGALKLTRLVNIVEDAQGEIFATKVGSLRLVVDKASDQTAWWLQGDKKISLVTVPLVHSQKLIYSELGVYDGQDLGTPCDHY